MNIGNLAPLAFIQTLNISMTFLENIFVNDKAKKIIQKNGLYGFTSFA